MTKKEICKQCRWNLLLVVFMCNGLVVGYAQDTIDEPPLPELLDLDTEHTALPLPSEPNPLELDETSFMDLEEGIKIIDPPPELSTLVNEPIPLELLEDMPPPVFEEDEVTVTEPEPTFEDLLSPELEKTPALKELDQRLLKRKAELKELTEAAERLTLKQTIFEFKEEQALLKIEKVGAVSERLHLKRDKVESKLADSTITAEKHDKLEARLAHIIEREARLNEKLIRLERKIKNIAKKLDNAESKLSMLTPIESEDDSRQSDAINNS